MAGMTGLFDYSGDGETYEGYLARPDAENAPIVLVSHAWGGQADGERMAAAALASLGYVGFAIDVYGKGKRGTSPAENEKLMNPLTGNRAELHKRLDLALATARGLEGADTSRIAAIGYCFGGLCVLDIARMGTDVKGVVSFHGIFRPAENIPEPTISAKVLALHGWDDPMAKPEDVVSFAEEMTKAGADWQFHGYGNTLHAFTNSEANAPEMGIKYNRDADRRSWRAMENFLEEIFS